MVRFNKFAVGDVVHLTEFAGFNAAVRSRTYEVTKVPVGKAGVNYTAKVVGGTLTGEPYTGRGVRAPEGCFEAGPAEKQNYATAMAHFEQMERFVLGEVVTVKNVTGGSKWKYAAGQKFVVVATRGEKVNVAKLGGEGDRYWKMNPRSLTKVEV